MVSKRETWKRFIKVILIQVPKYIDNYSTSEKELLNKFLAVLQHYEADTSEARKKFIENWNTYKEEFMLPATFDYTNDYYRMPFLWLAESYFERATELLDVARFHADEFFEYLAKHLRGSSETGGFFQLVRNGTALTDIKWEKLQYESIKLTVPLTLEEVHVLEQCYSYVREAGISAINPRNLRAAITKEVKTPKISKKIPQLLERVHSIVGLSWYYPAFDLARVYINFQLSESTSIEEIVDFNDPENGVLRCSDWYWVRDYKNLYLGIMVVPRHLVDSLAAYLQECHNQGKLILHECTMVIVDHMSSSLNYYEPGKGWHEWTVLEYARLMEQLKVKKKRGDKREKADASLHMTSFADSWHYLESSNHTQLIALFCNEKIHPYLRFRELPPKITKIEKDLLRELQRNQVVNVIFSPYHMVRDYSWDTYWITLPRPYRNLTRLLTCTPYAMIYSDENNYYIWVHLTPALAQWLKRELRWSIMRISQYFYRKFPKVEDYDFNMLEWKTPRVLEGYE